MSKHRNTWGHSTLRPRVYRYRGLWPSGGKKKLSRSWMGEGSGAMRVEAGMCTQAKGKKLVGGTQNSNLRKSISGAGHWRGGLRRVLRGEDSWGWNCSGSQCDTTWRPISSGWKLFQLVTDSPDLALSDHCPPPVLGSHIHLPIALKRGLKAFF